MSQRYSIADGDNCYDKKDKQSRVTRIRSGWGRKDCEFQGSREAFIEKVVFEQRLEGSKKS